MDATEMKSHHTDEFVAFAPSLCESTLSSYFIPGDNLWCSWRFIEPSPQDWQPLHFWRRTPPAFKLQRETNWAQTYRNCSLKIKLTLHWTRNVFHIARS